MVTIQHFINVFSSTSFVVVTDLTRNVEYQFEVVAVAELDGDVVMGERTGEYTEHVIPTSVPATQSVIGSIIGGVLAFLVAVVVVVVVVVIILLIRFCSRLELILPKYSHNETSFSHGLIYMIRTISSKDPTCMPIK